MPDLNILVIEDHPRWQGILQSKIQEALKQAGRPADIQIVENFEDGLKAIERTQPPWHLVVVDIGLPADKVRRRVTEEKLGMHLVERARVLCVPCIVVSSDTNFDHQDVADCFVKYGACDFLSKIRWDSDRLIARVRSILQVNALLPRQSTPVATEKPGFNAMKTVVDVDMEAYGRVVKQLDEGAGAESVAALNDMIQEFVTRGLDYIGLSREAVKKTTGDGAILVFDKASQAHWFAEGFHSVTWEHNQSRTERVTRRWFRVGAASGEITIKPNVDAQPDISGTTIVTATRLQKAAHVGELVIDVATYDTLPKALRDKYGNEETVEGKEHEHTFQARRYDVIPEARANSQA